MPKKCNKERGDIPLSGYALVTKYITNNQYWNLGNINVKGFVQHSVGVNQESADVIVNNANKSSYAASFHACVEPGRVIICAPCLDTAGVAKKCYHVGGSYNNTRIGVEMTEPNTIRYTGGSTYIDTNPEHTKDFMRRVTDTAAEFMADLCIFHNLPVSRICTHKEAHDRGCGSNHGDPEHVWKIIGYTPDDFRRDVQKYIDLNTGEWSWLDDMTDVQFNQLQQQQTDLICRTFDLKFEELYKNPIFTKYESINAVPDWGKEAVQWALDNKILQGDGRGLDLSESDLKNLVFEYRSEHRDIYAKLSDVPEYARAAVRKAMNNGYISGISADGTLNLSDDMVRMIFMLDKAGVFNSTETKEATPVKKGDK